MSLYHTKRKVLENIQFTAKAEKSLQSQDIMVQEKQLLLERYVVYINYLQEIFTLINKINIEKRAQLSYMVMQDVNYQLFAETVEKECVFGVKHPNPNLVRKALEEMDLVELVNRHPNTLSGGQNRDLL